MKPLPSIRPHILACESATQQRTEDMNFYHDFLIYEYILLYTVIHAIEPVYGIACYMFYYDVNFSLLIHSGVYIQLIGIFYMYRQLKLLINLRNFQRNDNYKGIDSGRCILSPLSLSIFLFLDLIF